VFDVGHDDGIEWVFHIRKGFADIDADKARTLAAWVDKGDDRDAGLDRAKNGDFGKVGLSRQHKAIETPHLRQLEHACAIALGLAKEREGIQQILNGETGFFCKPLRGQVIA
jgi:hypothetical protein